MSSGEHKSRGRELAELWAGAMIFAPHMAGCSCAGFHVPLDASAVEEDLIDFLAYRYKGEGLAALAEYVSSRATAKSMQFSDWLEQLDRAPVSEADRDRLMNDLSNTLESMNGARPAKAGFVCY